MPKQRAPDHDLPGPALTPAVAMATDPAYQCAYWWLVADRLTQARLALQEAHGDMYSQLRVARRVGLTQGYVSNVEQRKRRIDTTALLLLSAVYSITPETLVKPPRGRREEQLVERWMAEYRELQQRARDDDLRTAQRTQGAPSRQRRGR